MHQRFSPLAATGVLAFVLLSACSSDEPTESGATSDSTTAETSAAPSEEASATPSEEDATGSTGSADTTERTGSAEGAAVIETADTDLGTILVDDAGLTLYVFTQDLPGESLCVEECLEAWPVLEGEATAGDGVDSELLGSIEREDGTVQTTYAESPLYYFVEDARPGDVSGQDVGEVWYVVSPEGEPVTEVPAPSEG